MSSHNQLLPVHMHEQCGYCYATGVLENHVCEWYVAPDCLGFMKVAVTSVCELFSALLTQKPCGPLLSLTAFSGQGRSASVDGVAA